MAVEEPTLDFELLFRSAPSLLVVLEAAPGLRILGASDAYLRATRTRREAIVGRRFFEAFPEHPERLRPTGAASLAESFERVLATGAPDALNTPVADAAGRLRFIIHRVDSIEVELLRSACERDEALRKLRAANEELDAFARSASRDLLAPLRAVDGYCRLLREQAAALDAEGRRFVDKIGANAERMMGILGSLLALSSIGKSPLVREHVDLTRLACREVEALREREPGRDLEVRVAEGMAAWADEHLIGIAIANLVDNAWKFTATEARPRIEIGRRDVVGQAVYFVRDNGSGLDMARADRLFVPFSGLGDPKAEAGHGIGLATVKRVIERHGGEVWAEANPGKGATFSFTLGAPPVRRKG